MVVSGAAVTEHGTETIFDEYTINVDHEPVRIISITSASFFSGTINYNTHEISGEILQNFLGVVLSYNGTKLTWANRSRGSYSVKIGDGEWSDYVGLGSNYSSRAGMNILPGVDIQIKFKYSYSGTVVESEPYSVSIIPVYDIDRDVALTTTSETITINNEDHTITGTVASDGTVEIASSHDGVEDKLSNIYAFYPQQQLEAHTSDTHAAFSAESITTAKYINAYVRHATGDPLKFTDVYTVNVTISE